MTESLPNNWLDRVLFHRAPGIYVAPQQQSVDQITTEVRARGWLCFDASLRGIDSKAGLLGAVGRALHAFDGWGGNWDALVDVLRDLPEASGYVLVLDACGDPAISCGADWATLISILGDHIDDAGEGQPPLRVVLRDDNPRSGYCPA